MPGKDTNIGAKRAREARAAYGLDDTSPLACAVTLVEEHEQIPVVVGALPDRFAGALWRNGMGTIVWVNAAHGVERQRFTVAHELGHLRCGHEGTALDTPETMSRRTHAPDEVQANAFAAELIAPAAGVRAFVDHQPTLEDVVRLAAHFGMSTVAALYRYSTLGLLSARRQEQLQREIDDRLHHKLWDYLDYEPLRDVLAETEHPRLPASLEGS